MLRAILNKSWKQHPTKQKLHGHLPPITKTIQVRRTRHVGRCWRSKYELISDVLPWTLSHGRAKAGRPARTYILQLWTDSGCGPEDLSEAMDDREGWQEMVRDICADGTTWWRWWLLVYFLLIYFSLSINQNKNETSFRRKILKRFLLSFFFFFSSKRNFPFSI